MIYRDDALATKTRIAGLAREVAALRRFEKGPEARRLRHRRVEIRRARRLLARLRHRTWRLLPRSLGELAVAIAMAYGVATLALSVGFLVLCLVTGARAL